MDKLFSNIQNSLTSLQQNNNKNTDSSALLQRQQLTQQKINDLLEKSSQAISCGPTCQKLKISEELKQKYLDAETNIQTAPIKLEQTKKNYYIYTEGRPYYDNMKEEELKQKADKIATLLAEKFNTEISNANTMNTYLNTAITNSQYTKDLFNYYLEDNKKIKSELKESKGDILTNDRKTYYETDALNTLNLWYTFFWYIYYLLVLVLIVALILSHSNLTVVTKLLIAGLCIFYPYFITPVTNWLYNLWTIMSNNMPKNVYNNI